MSILFKSNEHKEALKEQQRYFCSRLPFATSSVLLETKFGKTHILRSGSTEHPPLILLHGMKTSSALVLHEAQGLSKNHQIIAVDIIGESVMSEDRRMSLTNDDYAEWFKEVLELLNISTANIFAVSFGGFIASKFAAKYPTKINRLSLMVPAGFVNGSVFEGLFKFGWPYLKYTLNKSDENFNSFLKYLLTTKEDHWVKYMRISFDAYKFSLVIPPLFTDTCFKDFKAPVQLFAAENDLSFPGHKLIQRSNRLFSNLREPHLIKDSYHCPPTTVDFQSWLASTVDNFFKQSI